MDVSLDVAGVSSTGSMPPAPRPLAEGRPDASLPADADVSFAPVEDLPAPSLWKRALTWLVVSSKRLMGSHSTPGFLFSFVLHTAILLGLAVWTIAGPGRGGWTSGIIESQSVQAVEAEIETLADPMLASGSDSADSETSAEAAALSAPERSQTVIAGAMGQALSSVTHATGLDQGVVAPVTQSAAGLMNQAMASSMNATLAATGVEGREPQSRNRLAMERGGSGESEAAVELALEWLAAHQKANGRWSLDHTTPRCGPHCTHPGFPDQYGTPDQYDPAATGLALLAFLGAGYTHRDGKYADTVKRGVYYLLQVMAETERGGSFMFNNSQGMYNQGIATFALCEAYQLSKDESLRQPSQQAINFIVYAQHDRGGGWGYQPERPGDLTITGWQTMALKSADAAGLYIPATTIVRLDEFLDSQGDKDKTFYGYAGPSPKNETCTAIAMLLRMFRGWPTSDPRVLTAANFLERQGVSSHDMYRNYYVTLLLFHIGGRTFEEWNPTMRDALIRTQDQNGHAKGSWFFEDRWGETGGRLYTTAMAAMTLEVYYRFAPLYQNVEKPFDF